MPSDDKGGLRLPDLTRRELGKGTVKGLAGLATDLITGPIAGEAISSITESSSVIPMTKNLVIEYYKLEDDLRKIFELDKYSSKWKRLDYDEKEEAEERRTKIVNYIHVLKNTIMKREELKEYLKSPKGDKYYGPDYDPTTSDIDLQQKIKDSDDKVQIMLKALEGKEELSNYNFTKEERNKIKKYLALENAQAELYSIAEQKQLPVAHFINEIEDRYGDAIGGDGGSGSWEEGEEKPINQILAEMRPDTIDNIFDNAGEDMLKYKILAHQYSNIDSKEFFNAERAEVKQALEQNDIKKYRRLFPFRETRALWEIITPKQQDALIDNITKQLIIDKKENLESTLQTKEMDVDWSAYGGFIPPSKNKRLTNILKDEMINAGKEIAVEEGAKLGKNILTDLYNKYKVSSKPSGSTIESDKTRASKAKVVEEVKPETKKEPPRNWRDDLQWLMRRGKSLNPLMLLSLSGDVPQHLLRRKNQPEESLADIEYQIEQDPRANQIKQALARSRQEVTRARQEGGRINRDPYKNYNKQRAI